MRTFIFCVVLSVAGASNVWQALHAKVESDLKPTRERSGFDHLLKNLKSTGTYGEYKYDQGATVSGIKAWAIPADLKKQVQARVRSMIRGESSVEYRSFALRMQGGPGILHEIVCSMRHVPGDNSTPSQTVELAFVYAQTTADLIQQYEDNAGRYCCNRIFYVCIRHCMDHKQVSRGLNDSEFSLVFSGLVHESYEYLLSSISSSAEVRTKHGVHATNHNLGSNDDEASPVRDIAAAFTI